MGYDSTINFTLDTICPWTYIAKKRLDRARAQIKESHPDVKFSLHIHPYQLHRDAPVQGEDKYTWYKTKMYNGSDEQMKKYTTYMSALGVAEGIDFKFGGTIASTLDAHRIIQWVQEKYGEEKAEQVVMSLYHQYFEKEQAPAARSTLLTATKAAGVPESEAAQVIDDSSEGLQDVKMMINEQAGNGVDAVPYVLIEGKRRDFTLEGAKEVAEYVKTMEAIIRESN